MLGLPIAAAALRFATRGDDAAIALAVLIAIAAVGGFSKAEAERIWLFLAPLACVAAAPAISLRRLTLVVAALLDQALAVGGALRHDLVTTAPAQRHLSGEGEDEHEGDRRRIHTIRALIDEVSNVARGGNEEVRRPARLTAPEAPGWVLPRERRHIAHTFPCCTSEAGSLGGIRLTSEPRGRATLTRERPSTARSSPRGRVLLGRGQPLTLAAAHAVPRRGVLRAREACGAAPR
jgi:hypothetical protein